MSDPKNHLDRVVARAAQSHGRSTGLYALVARLIREEKGSGTLLDVGCGSGALLPFVDSTMAIYRGCDVVRYSDFPGDRELVLADLDQPPFPIASDSIDVTVSIETIEHLENPRAFFRELARVTKSGGLLIVTTPNQLSLLSLATLILRKEFNSFQQAPGLYPAHLTALLASDLLRIASETGLAQPTLRYSDAGRIPGTARPWPTMCRGRLFSDNVVLIARKP